MSDLSVRVTCSSSTQKNASLGSPGVRPDGLPGASTVISTTSGGVKGGGGLEGGDGDGDGDGEAGFGDVHIHIISGRGGDVRLNVAICSCSPLVEPNLGVVSGDIRSVGVAAAARFVFIAAVSTWAGFALRFRNTEMSSASCRRTRQPRRPRTATARKMTFLIVPLAEACS